MIRETFDFISTQTGRPMRAVFEPAQPGVRFAEKPVVKFYDRTHPFTPDGQATGASYYAETLLDRIPGAGLILHGGVPEWNLSDEDMRKVLAALRAWLNDERVYVVGLPVIVTVDKTGAVKLSVDAADLDESALYEALDNQEERYTADEVHTDTLRIVSAYANKTMSATVLHQEI